MSGNMNMDYSAAGDSNLHSNMKPLPFVRNFNASESNLAKVDDLVTVSSDIDDSHISSFHRTPTKPSKRHGKGLSPRSSNHLQRFVDAKKKIGSIFDDLDQFVQEANGFLAGLMGEEKRVVSESVLTDVGNIYSSVLTIKEMLARDHMKVVFFGRTSNGKSTVVNSMLHSKILPQGMGHTTRCFLQVEGSQDERKYVSLEDGSGERGVEAIDNLANAICSQEMGEDALIRIYWPKSDSRLLKNEVTLVDSPGVDLSPEFDNWIDKHCLDADVFVLVCNAESTLTQAEKNFFHRVSSKLSRPNLFILNNRWDASAAEPEYMNQVREQHMQRFSAFLVDELKVCSADEVQNRVFFVSAKEVLHQRMKEKGLNTPNTFLADGFQARSLEFARFEEQFETCISKSAIRTKFEAHIRRGRDISGRLLDIFQQQQDQIAEKRKGHIEMHMKKKEALQQNQMELMKFLKRSKEDIMKLSSEVQLRVSSDFADTIRRLEGYIDSFQQPFVDSGDLLETYKKELVSYIDQSVSDDLNIRFTGGLKETIDRTERFMIDNMCRLLPEASRPKAQSVLQYRDPFRFSITLDCGALAEDFQEDLEFRFSLGLTQLIRRFVRLRRDWFSQQQQQPNHTASNSLVHREDSAASSSTPFFGGALSRYDSTQSNDHYAPAVDQNDEDKIMRNIIMSSASYAANGGVGLLIVGGLVSKTLGWRVIALLGASYAGIYFWERTMWNSKAKESHFKSQLRRHLSVRLRQLSQMVTKNCDAQVTREVTEVLTRLQGVAKDSQMESKEDLESLVEEIEALDKVAKGLKENNFHASIETECSYSFSRFNRILVHQIVSFCYIKVEPHSLPRIWKLMNPVFFKSQPAESFEGKVSNCVCC